MKRVTSIRHAQRLLSAFSGISPHFRPPSAPAVGGRLPTGDGRPLRGLERDHRGDDHGRRLNRRLGQDVSSKPRLITPNHHIGQLGRLKLTMPSGQHLTRTALSPPMPHTVWPTQTTSRHLCPAGRREVSGRKPVRFTSYAATTRMRRSRSNVLHSAHGSAYAAGQQHSLPPHTRRPSVVTSHTAWPTGPKRN
jgi:hypothetical protein